LAVLMIEIGQGVLKGNIALVAGATTKAPAVRAAVDQTSAWLRKVLADR
jgi:hypothetical protein